MRARVLVPIGNGLNSNEETTYVYRQVGARVDEIHIEELMRDPARIGGYHIIDFVGGFIDGDHVAAGIIQANRVRNRLRPEIIKFIQNGKLIIGICNGFQAIVKSGILPAIDGDYTKQTATLAGNDSGRFEDRWVHLVANKNSNCVWTRGIDRIYLPVRHGEGKFTASEETLASLRRGNQDVLFYADGQGRPTMEHPSNPNGSADGIAGIADPSGRVFGMMPHREVYWSPFNHPNWPEMKIEGKLPEEGAGIVFSRNAVTYVAENL